MGVIWKVFNLSPRARLKTLKANPRPLPWPDTKHHLQFAMNSSEKFCLKWDDFQTNIVSSFPELRNDEDFSDVTLVCEDNTQIRAHKVILGACSPFFNSVLRRNQHPNPLLYMRGVKTRDLTALVDFVYNGEAEVFQEDLDSFLALAEEVKLKGLTGNEPVEEIESQEAHSPLPTKKDEQPFYKTASKSQGLKQEGLRQQKYPVVENTAVSETIVNMATTAEELEEKIDSLMTREITGWACNNCGKKSRDRTDMKRHIETHTEGITYNCNICGKSSRSENGRRQHIKRIH